MLDREKEIGHNLERIASPVGNLDPAKSQLPGAFFFACCEIATNSGRTKRIIHNPYFFASHEVFIEPIKGRNYHYFAKW